jgi:hypothetical protein
MTVLLSPFFGAFLKETVYTQQTLERQSLMNSHRQRRWISYDLELGNYPKTSAPCHPVDKSDNTPSNVALSSINSALADYSASRPRRHDGDRGVFDSA